MPRGSDIYKSKWLKAEHLEDDEQTFTIVGSGVDEFEEKDGSKKAQITLQFSETEKQLGLNVTNYRVLTDIFKSDDSDDWHGRRVVLFVTQTTMTDGRAVDCLRVKKKATERLMAEDGKRHAARPARQQPPAHPHARQQPAPLTQAEADGEDDGGDIPF